MPKKQIPPVEKPAALAPHARQIMRSAIKVSLATNDRKQSWPFLSLTSVATLMDGIPILLLSSIAHHTRNIAIDPHVALLFDGTPQTGNPLQEGRITLHGTLQKDTGVQSRKRFMARHPAAFYAEFSDFDFYTLQLHSAHYVAGFGSTNTLSPAHLLLTQESLSLQSQEQELIQTLTQQHQNTIQYMGDRCCPKEAGTPGLWHISALDPEGCDLMKGETTRGRYDFWEQARTPQDIMEAFSLISQTKADPP